MTGPLERAIALLVDGLAVDWDRLLDEADDETRARLIQLRVLADMDVAHAGDDPPPTATIGISAPGVRLSRPTWGHLELLEELARGSHGVVHRAWDTRLAREVALKLLMPGAPDASLAEGRRLARVSHPSVVSIHGADRHDGQIGLWMELLRGRTLEALILEQGPMSAREATVVGRDICGAVAAIHAAGLLHRDIKAQNVMREPGGRLVVMDMSASVDSDESRASMAGTPMYMAPELFVGATPSVASDIYALGVLLYRLVTASFPIEARTVDDVRRAHETGEVRPLREVRADLPGAFVAVVERCLRPVPAERFPSASALERALVAADAGFTPARRSRVLLTAAGVALMVCIGLGAWATMGPAARHAGPTTDAAVPLVPAQYEVIAGFEALAFSRLATDPAGAAAATRSALALTRPALPGHHPLFVLTYSRLSEASRLAADAEQAERDLLDAGAHATSSLRDASPLTAVLALESARTLQARGDHRGAIADLRRALVARWLGFGLPWEGSSIARRFERGDELERSSASVSLSDDSDGDGLLDLVEVVAGLRHDAVDTDADGTPDGDDQFPGVPVDTSVALGLPVSSFLVATQSDGQPPRSLGWHSPPQFPMSTPDRMPPDAWTVEATSSMAYFFQRLPADLMGRAVRRGFSLFARVRPVAGLATIALDTSPHGPRFDVLVSRGDGETVNVRLASSIVPRLGPVYAVPASTGRGPLLELRYSPTDRSASLYADGRRVHAGHPGQRQFLDQTSGVVSWGVAREDASLPEKPSAQFALIWLQVR